MCHYVRVQSSRGSNEVDSFPEDPQAAEAAFEATVRGLTCEESGYGEVLRRENGTEKCVVLASRHPGVTVTDTVTLFRAERPLTD